MNLKPVRDAVKKALPKGWKARVHQYAGGVRCYVQRAPVDLIGLLKESGLNLGSCGHFESDNVYPFINLKKHSADLSDLYDALLEAVPVDTHVWLGVGAKDDPFNHVVKPPKALHPKVKAYADYAKAVASLHAKEDAKRLVPNAARKLLKLRCDTWC